MNAQERTKRNEGSHMGLAVCGGRVLPLLRISASSSINTGASVPPTGPFMRRLSVILKMEALKIGKRKSENPDLWLIRKPRTTCFLLERD